MAELTAKEWLRVGVAVGLFVIALLISHVIVGLLSHLILIGAFIILACYLGGIAVRLMGIAPGAPLWKVLVPSIIAIIMAALIVWIFGNLIKVITMLVLAWLLFKWMLKEFAGDIAKELDEYLWGE